MIRHVSARWLLAALGSVVLVAACGAASPGSSGSSSAKAQTVTSESVSLSGTTQAVLANGSGRTLYYFLADKGGRVTCTGGCAKEWMPLKVSGTPSGGSGVSGKLGTANDPSGGTVATYNGWPLYTYIGDTGPHQTHGDGVDDFGSQWYAVRTNVASTGPGSGQQGGGYGSGY